MDKIIFEEGLFGFEQNREFIPVAFEEKSDAMFTLQSAEEKDLSFVIMNPFLLMADYSPEISPKELESLGEAEGYLWYVICVPREPVEKSTVNLKCPIVINPMNQKAKQVILNNQEYSLRHSLEELTRRESKAC